MQIRQLIKQKIEEINYNGFIRTDEDSEFKNLNNFTAYQPVKKYKNIELGDTVSHGSCTMSVVFMQTSCFSGKGTVTDLTEDGYMNIDGDYRYLKISQLKNLKINE